MKRKSKLPFLYLVVSMLLILVGVVNDLNGVYVAPFILGFFGIVLSVQRIAS
jgi:hypothetical protein